VCLLARQSKAGKTDDVALDLVGASPEAEDRREPEVELGASLEGRPIA